jgi:hypothetical protein
MWLAKSAYKKSLNLKDHAAGQHGGHMQKAEICSGNQGRLGEFQGRMQTV